MAGIAGIIDKKNTLKRDALEGSLAGMMQKLSYSGSRLNGTFIGPDICFGNCLPLSCAANEHYQHNDQLGILAVIDGLVFVDFQERKILSGKYEIEENASHYFLIPFLYDFYGKNFVQHITGWFNICIYEQNQASALLINDRLGYLPLYYYDSDAYFIFASKIESILNSGLGPAFQPDPTTIAEHLFFHYPISDHTYVQDINTLSNAEYLKVTPDKTERGKYWSMAELYGYRPADRQQSLEMMNQGLNLAMAKALAGNKDTKLNFTLTGGWDSRVVLSLCLPACRDRLSAYSFGAINSSDIVIPKQLAGAEGLDYTPYVLDQRYLDHDFLPHALKTIELSGGARNYKRAHYLYAVQQRADVSDLLLTGIFGDEVFKVAGPGGGEVLSTDMIDFIGSDFDLDLIRKKFSSSTIPDILHVERETLIQCFIQRLEIIKDRMTDFESISQKHYAFRFEYNLRKYFGQEASSYNDFMYCFSPFIDYDFLHLFAQSAYFGTHYPFGSQSMGSKKQSTRLYHDITRKNYKPLIFYNSARGYSMRDASGMLGNIRIFYKKYINSQKDVDGFNTRSTDDIFASFLQKSNCNPMIFSDSNHQNNPFIKKSDYYSLYYWLGEMHQRYDFKC